MANSKISALTSATTPLAGTEILPIVQSSTTKKVSVADLTVGRDVTAQALNVDSSVGLLGNWNTTTSNGGYLRWQTNGTSIWDLGSAKQVFNTGTANDGGLASRAGYYFGLGANGSEILRLTTDGNATIVQAAKGINFTANTPAAGMTNQLLNWYEEGTWTPTDSSGEGLTLTAANAVYTRIGRLVTVSAVITYPTTASALAMEMSGLPFTAGAPVSSGVLTNDNQTNMALVNTSNTYVRLYAVPNAAFTRTTNAQLSGKSIYLNITYPV